VLCGYRSAVLVQGLIALFNLHAGGFKENYQIQTEKQVKRFAKMANKLCVPEKLTKYYNKQI
jgi:hypothetical protein